MPVPIELEVSESGEGSSPKQYVFATPIVPELTALIEIVTIFEKFEHGVPFNVLVTFLL